MRRYIKIALLILLGTILFLFVFCGGLFLFGTGTY